MDVNSLLKSLIERIQVPFYEKWALPCHERIFRNLNRDVPSILFAKEFSDLKLMASSGAAALSIGNVVDLSEAIEQFPELIFQGNVDNRIIAEGDLDKISDATLNCLKQSGGKNHILNLSHGLVENTSLESVLHFINTSHSMRITNS